MRSERRFTVYFVINDRSRQQKRIGRYTTLRAAREVCLTRSSFNGWGKFYVVMDGKQVWRNWSAKPIVNSVGRNG